MVVNHGILSLREERKLYVGDNLVLSEVLVIAMGEVRTARHHMIRNCILCSCKAPYTLSVKLSDFTV